MYLTTLVSIHMKHGLTIYSESSECTSMHLLSPRHDRGSNRQPLDLATSPAVAEPMLYPLCHGFIP